LSHANNLAYYPDRLAERGRAYIRDFLTGDIAIKKRLNAEKAEWELYYEALRKLVYIGLGNAPKKRSERIFDVIVREKIAGKCRSWINGELAQLWHKDGLDCSPWHSNMDGSMF